MLEFGEINNHKGRYHTIYTCELIAGRNGEAKMSLAKQITESVMKHTGTPHETIYIIYDEMSKDDFYPHGKLNK